MTVSWVLSLISGSQSMKEGHGSHVLNQNNPCELGWTVVPAGPHQVSSLSNTHTVHLNLTIPLNKWVWVPSPHKMIHESKSFSYNVIFIVHIWWCQLVHIRYPLFLMFIKSPLDILRQWIINIIVIVTLSHPSRVVFVSSTFPLNPI